MRTRELLIALFITSRIIMAFVADHPSVYPAGSADASSDISMYEDIARRSVSQELTAGREGAEASQPYRDFHVGYPPGALPIMVLPHMVNADDYRLAFVVESIVLDALGLWAIYRIAKRRQSWWPLAAWVVLLPALGPVAYTRLDMAVAAAVAWALERLDRENWTGAAVFLSVGAAIKVTPALLLPALVLSSPNRLRTAGAAIVTGTIVLIPFIGSAGDIYEEVMAGNVDRGVHSESLWGSFALLTRATFGITAEVVYAFGAWDLHASYTATLKTAANVLAVAVLLASAAFAAWRVRKGDARHAVLAMAATLVLLTAVGRVFSPQYLAPLVPLVAASLAIAPRRTLVPAGLMTGAIVLAHVIYPVAFRDYLDGDALAVLIGVMRNVALLAAGLLFARAAWRYTTPEPDRDRTAGEAASAS